MYNMRKYGSYLKYVLPLPVYMIGRKLFFYSFTKWVAFKSSAKRLIYKFLNSLAYLLLPAHLYIKLRNRAVIWKNRSQPVTNAIADSPLPESSTQRDELLYVFEEIADADDEGSIQQTLARNNLKKLIDRDLMSQEVVNLQDAVIKSDKNTCEVVICCAFSGRYSILRTAILESFGGNKPADVMWVLVGTTPEDMLFIESMAITTGRIHGFQHENQPLGAKWQAGVDYAMEKIEFELLSIVGSDDIASHALIRHALYQHQNAVTYGQGELQEFRPQKTGLFYVDSWIVVSASKYSNVTPTIVSCRQKRGDYFIPLGAGRFYSAEFLKSVSGNIFDTSLSRLLDDKGYHQINESEFGSLCIALEEYPLISVKGEWAMLNSTKDIFLAENIATKEYTFAASRILKEALTISTFDYLFTPKQFNFEWQAKFGTA